MPRRKECNPTRHKFKPIRQGSIKEKCEDCDGLFPCDVSNGECGHSDCIEVRGFPPKCFTCGKDIKPEDWFGLAPPGRNANLGFLPVHNFCVDAAESRLLVESPGLSHQEPKQPKEGLNRFQATAGMGVKLSEELESVYRAQIGELVDELVVEKVVDTNRVIVKWVGMVPMAHLRSK